MRRRIVQLEAEKIKLIDHKVEDADESPKDHLCAINKDLAIARERLVHLGREPVAQPQIPRPIAHRAVAASTSQIKFAEVEHSKGGTTTARY